MDAEEKPAEPDNMKERVVIYTLQPSSLFIVCFFMHKFKEHSLVTAHIC